MSHEFGSLQTAKLFQGFAADRVKIARSRVDVAGYALGSTASRDHEVSVALSELSQALNEYGAITSEVRRLQDAA